MLTYCQCSDNSKKISDPPKKYSKNQEYLFKLLDEYKSEISAVKSHSLKETVQRDYKEKLVYFLWDSLGGPLDSINVTVDTVIQEGWLVTTRFHTRDIEFKYGMEFRDSMPPRVDSFYKWMRNLKPKSDLLTNFLSLGDVEVNFPDDKTRRTIRIFACPEPLWLKQK